MKIQRTAKVTGFDASVVEAMAWIEENLPSHNDVLNDNDMGLSEDNPDDLVFLKRIARKEQMIKASEELLNACEPDSAEFTEYEREVTEYKLQLNAIKKTAFGVDRTTKATTYYTAGSFMAAVKEACRVLNANQPAWLEGQQVAIIGGSVDEENQKFGIKRYTPKTGGKRTKQTTMDARVAKLDAMIGYEEEEEEAEYVMSKEEAISELVKA